VSTANTDLVGENTSLQEEIHGKRVFVFCQLTLVLISTELEDDLLAAQTTYQTLKIELEVEVVLKSRLRSAIDDLSTSWELDPTNEAGEAARAMLLWINCAIVDGIFTMIFDH